MHGWLDSLLRVPLAALSPLERFEAAGSELGRSHQSMTWLWTVLLAAVLSVVTAVLAIALLRRAKQFPITQKRRSFAWHAKQLGLSSEERHFLSHISQLAGLKDQESIITADTAFEQGITRLVYSHRVQALSPELQKKIDLMVGALRRKLGFQQDNTDAQPASATTRQIPAGEALTICPANGTDFFEATVESVSADELTVRVAGSRQPPAAKSFLVRYPNLGSVWEFNANLVRQDGLTLGLAHTTQIRFVNWRQFPRMPTFKPAYLACLPFLPTEAEFGPPPFVEARVVEIAGPGLLLEAPVATAVGQRVVVAVRLDGSKIVQAFGKVRRASPVQDGVASVAVELLDLNESEVGEMAKATNAAAHLAGEERASYAHANASKGS